MQIDKNLGLGCTRHRTDDQKHLPWIPNKGQRERERERDNGRPNRRRSHRQTGVPGWRWDTIVPVTGLTAEMDGSWILGGCSILGTR